MRAGVGNPNLVPPGGRMRNTLSTSLHLLVFTDLIECRSDIFQRGFIHPEVVSQFMEHSLPDLATDFGCVGADRLDVLPVEDDAVRTDRQVKDASRGGRQALKNSQNQTSSLAGPRVPGGPTRLSSRSPGRLVLNQNREVVDSFAKLFWKCVEYFRNQLNEVFPLHLAHLTVRSLSPQPHRARP